MMVAGPCFSCSFFFSLICEVVCEADGELNSARLDGMPIRPPSKRKHQRGSLVGLTCCSVNGAGEIKEVKDLYVFGGIRDINPYGRKDVVDHGDGPIANQLWASPLQLA